MLQLLMETVSATDKENAKRGKRARAGSVPPRSKTPSNPPHHYLPATTHGGGGGGGHSTKNGGAGAVTPAVRPGSSMAMSAQPTSKRPRLGLGESTAAHNNAPAHGHPQPYLGSSRGPGAHRPGSPSKIPSKPSSSSSSLSSLPRPVPLAMPVPKPGTAHHALGHGRVPSAQAQAQYGQVRAASASYRGPGSYASQAATTQCERVGEEGVARAEGEFQAPPERG